MNRLVWAAGAALIPCLGVAPSALAQESYEITVTAQRRAENVNDVPIAISTVTAQDLENARALSTKDLTLVVPSLDFTTKAVFAQPTIRGIGSSVVAPGAENNIAVYVDGVYQPNESGNLFGFNNIERVEVLKGPQGTLFGRNATGGAILVHTREPDLGDMSADVGLSYGSYNEFQANAFANIPLGDRAALNVAALYNRDDGYFDNVTTGNTIGQADYVGARGRLLFEANDDLRFVLSGNYYRTTDNSVYAVQPINGNNANAQPPFNLTFPTTPYDVALSYEPVVETEVWGTSLNVSWDVGHGAFTSITSYQEVTPIQYFDSDYSPRPQTYTRQLLPSETFMQEINYASDYDGRFNWVGGIFLFKDHSPLDLRVFAEPTDAQLVHRQGAVDTQAEAIYAQGDFNLTDSLVLTAGARYSSETKEANGGLFGVNQFDVRDNWDSFTPRVALRYALNDDTNIYASFAQGFKSGVYNLHVLDRVPVDPEEIDAYEIGFKHQGPRFSLNAAAFHYDYENIQVTLLTTSGGVISAVLQNAAAAESNGAEIEATYRPSENWSFQGGVSYLDAEYTEYPNALVTVPNPGGGNSQVPTDAAGFDMTQAPEWTANLRATYSQPMFGGDFEASAIVYYHDSFYWYPGDPYTVEPAYTLVNGHLSWSPADGRYRISLWGENLGDELYSEWTTTNATHSSQVYAPPRTIGISLDLSF